MTADYSIWFSKYLQSFYSMGGYERGELIRSRMVRFEQSVLLFTEIDTDYICLGIWSCGFYPVFFVFGGKRKKLFSNCFQACSIYWILKMGVKDRDSC